MRNHILTGPSFSCWCCKRFHANGRHYNEHAEYSHGSLRATVCSYSGHIMEAGAALALSILLHQPGVCYATYLPQDAVIAVSLTPNSKPDCMESKDPNWLNKVLKTIVLSNANNNNTDKLRSAQFRSAGMPNNLNQWPGAGGQLTHVTRNTQNFVGWWAGASQLFVRLIIQFASFWSNWCWPRWHNWKWQSGLCNVSFGILQYIHVW